MSYPTLEKLQNDFDALDSTIVDLENLHDPFLEDELADARKEQMTIQKALMAHPYYQQ